MVIERVLPDPDNGDGKTNLETLHLRTGRAFSALSDASKDGGGRLRALAASEGDLFVEYDDVVSKKWALVSAGLKLSDFPASRWDHATPADLVEALKHPTTVHHLQHFGATLYMLPEEVVPLTLAFETRDGARGLLQVTGFSDNPRGERLRYKLLQNDSPGGRK